MRYAIVIAPEAIQDLKRLKTHSRAMVRDGIEKHLRHQPTSTRKTRIKRLRGLFDPQYRLRVGEVRVFYDVSERTVEILAIILKSDAEARLKKVGEPR
jgi:mRNA-degrading endonuclease RelE of RelBE toxin-antitoxin system